MLRPENFLILNFSLFPFYIELTFASCPLPFALSNISTSSPHSASNGFYFTKQQVFNDISLYFFKSVTTRLFPSPFFSFEKDREPLFASH